MADIRSELNRYKDFVGRVGKSSLHTLKPRDFEYYFMSLELVNLSEEGEDTIDYFAFPVMPSSITKSENSRISVTKTATSNVIINSQHFVPHDITIKGDFGRAFKLLISPETINAGTFKGIRYSIRSGTYSASDLGSENLKQLSTPFNSTIKTGYGCIKILQSIVDKARGVNETGKPFRLYLYNPALGESYIVVPTQNPLILQQDENRNNMIWGYTLNLTIVGQIQGMKKTPFKRSLLSITDAANIQETVTKLGRDLSNYIISRS